MNQRNLPRIHFDANGYSGRIALTTIGGLADIAALGDRLHDGADVMLNDSGELEIEAVLSWVGDHWIARPIGDWIHLD